jgi:YegS/Rv2252/BmrU family lipid kinase
MKRVLIVGNPIAGRGAARPAVERLCTALRARGHAVDLVWTGGPGDAARLAAEHGPGRDAVVAAGGDGTLREVYTGVQDLAPLVPLALGTANMMARELAIPGDVERLVDLIEAGTERRIDVGRVGDACFLAVVGVGFDAMVTEVIARRRRGALGYRGYLLPILRAALRYRRPSLRVALDGRPPLACGFVIVSKIARYGGVMRLSDRARVDSGALEVCVVEPANACHLIFLAPFALTGTLHRAPGVRLESARTVRVEATEAVPVEVDGDYFGTTPLEIGIESGAARVLAPAVPARADRRP